MKHLITWLALLLPMCVQAQVNGSIQRTDATNTVRHYNATGPKIDSLVVYTGALTNGYILQYNSTKKKWDIVSTSSIAPTDYWTTNTTQTGLTGDKTTSGTITSAKIIVNGTVDTGTPDAAVLIDRTLSGANPSGHGFRDMTNFQRPTAAYNSFDAAFTLGNSFNYDHGAGFQSRLNVSTSGTTTNLYGLYHQPSIGNGIVTNNYGAIIYDPILSGGGSAVSNFGVYIDELTAGSSSNYAIWTDGTTPSRFGGAITGGSFIKSGGTSSQFLKADGSSDGSSYLTTAVTSLTGTSNQISVSASTGSVTLSTPQDIGTASSPTFASQTLTGRLIQTTSTSATAQGQQGYNSSIGWYIWPKAGSSFDFNFYNSAGNSVVYNPTGTTNLTVVGNISAANLASGTYTPTLTNVANIGSSSANTFTYIRVGNVVSVSGSVTINPTAGATLTQLGVSLPVASNFTSTLELTGNGTTNGAVSTAVTSGPTIQSDSTNDRGNLAVTPVSTSTLLLFVTFQYQVL